MSFWIIVTIFIIMITLLMALALFRKRDGDLRSGAELDLEVYRDQLKAVETDLDRNVISKQESARVKTEISRRILDADKAVHSTQKAQSAPKQATIGAIALIAILLSGSAWVYQQIGQPGYPDLPIKSRYEAAKEARENRQSQSQVEGKLPPTPSDVDPQMLDLVAKLRDAVSKRPNDLTGHEYLSRYEAAIGEYKNAYLAQIRIIELKKEEATANDYALLADLMVMAAGGYVSPEAEIILKKSLDKDPENGIALFLTGRMFAQFGRADITFNIWRDLLERSVPSDPWYTPVRGQITEAARIAGVKYQLPEISTGPALAGPSAGDVAAAAEMTEEDRGAFIKSMVARLTERLTTEGGSPQEWAQLIGALGVQGNKDQARTIVAKAKIAHAGDAAALEIISQAAKRAGVAD